jgi:hypothetical protein
VQAKHYFRLRVAAGPYVLLADSEGLIFCGPVSVRVTAGQTHQVTVPTRCGVP